MYSAGFHTTALPHRSAGTRYQDGTATGKLPAVTMAATPTGLRNVNSCLSGISLGTVWPYSRRPSPRKKLQVSTTSCTSPRDSAIGLPISRVMRRASASRLDSTSRPSCWIARPRTGAGTAAQPGWASRAVRHASSKVPASPRFASATRSSSRAGFAITVIVPPGEPSTGLPPTSEDTVRVAEVTMAGWYRRPDVRVPRMSGVCDRLRPMDWKLELVYVPVTDSNAPRRSTRTRPGSTWTTTRP